MRIDPLLLEVLACPCPQHAPVVPGGSADEAAPDTLVCSRCKTRFPVTDGIPVMLLDQATVGPHGVGADLGQEG